MTSIVAYGASVTAQSGIAGYAPLLKSRLEEVNVSLSICALGSCHFDDLGFFKISNVLLKSPDYVLMDWNSTGLGGFSEKKLHCVLSLLAQKKIVPIFLIFPRKDTNLLCDRLAEKQVLFLHEEFNLPVLDLRSRIDVSICLRDDVHTNEVGAQIYSDNIFKFICSCLSSFDGAQFFSKFNDVVMPPVEWVNLNSEQKYTNVCLEIDVFDNTMLDVGISTIIGPYSPNVIVKVICEGASYESEFCFWDRWCYYERNKIFSILDRFNGLSLGKIYLYISVSQSAPDYSSCNESNFTYSGDMFFFLNSIFFSGCNLLKVEEI